ncbi:MAG: energy-coupling factor ABC transporter permease [Deltaproteobacteria bacterium]|nr:energy-coupling factor ABC transporter permease [Deltaproteobacteria bacterium]
MHLPDGSLSVPVWVATDALAIGAVAVSARLSARKLGDRRAPLMGVMGAFVFAAQMVNFPLPGGTSGHLLGAVLLAVLLGPAVATLVMFCVLLVQALLFQDGGLTALGANLVNMGLCGSLGGFFVYRLVGGKRPGTRRDLAIVLACWLAVVAGALLAGLELWLSGTAPLGPVLLAMGTVHAVVGLVEGLITVAAVRLLAAARPGLLEAA